jgi:hypothetical protein
MSPFRRLRSGGSVRHGALRLTDLGRPILKDHQQIEKSTVLSPTSMTFSDDHAGLAQVHPAAVR